ncbi:MAG: sensor histidine kinase [Elusimicrobiota bacterium]
MLYEFLVANRERVLALTRQKAADIAGDKPISDISESGLTPFYEHLIRELKCVAHGRPKRDESRRGSKHSPNHAAKRAASSTARHGEELSRLGYTISQVVHGYGVLCQAITETAQEEGIAITAGEFSALNLSLDTAIADAVTGFTKQAGLEDIDSAKRMGFLVHELRNALAAAIVAHSMVKKGVIGVGGSTNALLERNLNRMRDILDRSFSEIRMHNDSQALQEPIPLLGVIEEVEATASEEARSKGLRLDVSVEPLLQCNGDRNYLISALSNLVQNAIKYSRKGGIIRVRGLETARNVLLEVEDECGGLPPGRAEELFKPFVQKNSNRTGLGLGLSISRQAVSLNRGALSVRDLPGKGCIFTISLPRNESSRAWEHARRVLSQAGHKKLTRPR